MPTSLTDQMFETDNGEKSLSDQLFEQGSKSLTDQMFGGVTTDIPTEIPIESIREEKVAPNLLMKEHTQRVRDFFQKSGTENLDVVEDEGLKDKVGNVIGETLKGFTTLATHPIDIVKGGLDIALSIPGFLTGLLDAGSSASKEILDQVVLGDTLNLEEVYNKASEGMQRSMEFFEPGKELIIGEPTEASSLASQVVMAPLTGLSMVGHKVAGWEGFKDYPNIRGAARFTGDIAGMALMGVLIHGKSSRKKFTKDVEEVVKAGEEIIAKEQTINEIPNELIRQTQLKVLEIQKKQLELRAEEISKEFSKDVLIREELGRQAETLAKEKLRPVEDTGLKKPIEGKEVKPKDDLKIKQTEPITSYRGEDSPWNPNIGHESATEGVGLYVTPNKKLAKEFGDVKKVVYKRPKNPLNVINEDLPLLHESDIVFDPIKETDSVWIKSNKEAVKRAKVTDTTWDTSKVNQELTNVLKEKGYDAVNIDSGGKWSVILDKDLIIREKTDIKIFDDIITEVDQATGTKVPNIEGEQSPFFQDLKKTVEFEQIYNDRAKAVTENVEIFTQKLINDVNQWYHKMGEIPIEQVREGLSGLAARADELRGEFITGQDHLIWKETVSEAAAWARKLDRLEIKQTKELTKQQKIDKLYETINQHKKDKPKTILRKGGVKLTSGVDPAEGFKAIIAGAKSVSDYAKTARGFKKFKPKEAIKSLKQEFTRAFVDRSGNIRTDLLNKLGNKGYEIIQKMYLAKGASSISSNYLHQMQKEIYAGLSKAEKNILDNVILADRVGDIAKYKTPKQFKYPKGLEPNNVVAYSELFGQIEKLSPEKVLDIRNRAKGYFEWMKKPLKDMFDSGLITEVEFEALSSHNYRRLKLIDIYDKRNVTKVGDKKRTVYDSGVESLSRGRDTDVFEPSSEIMALEVFNRAYGRILNNEANKTLLDVSRSDPQNPFVRVKENKGDPIPSGWNRSFVYEGGERKAIYLSPELSKEWITSSPETTYRLSQILRYSSGSPVLRTFATGINWGFALANLPRDIMHTWFAARTFKDGKWSSVYSPTAPIAGLQMGTDLTTTFSDAVLRKGRYQDYINEGGGMEFLTHQGRLFQKGRHLENPIDKVFNFMGYFGETSEIMTRLAIRDRVIKRRAKEQGLTYEQARKNKKITRGATFAARDYMDFGQGGGVAKALDNAVPYLNASIQGTRGLFRSFQPGSGTALSSTYKLAQFAALTTGLTIAAWKMSPLTMENLEGNIDAQNNLIIPLGDEFGFEDINGQVRYPYIKIPLDPGQKFFKTFFESSASKWLGKEIDVNRVVDSLKEQSPVGVSSLPPTISGTIGYISNKDFWLNEDIWNKTDKPFSYPKSKEEFTDRTPQVYIDLGQATGLSPERTRYAVEELVTNGTIWSYLLGQGYEKLFHDMPKDQREKHLAEVLARTPLSKKFIGITNPYSKHASKIEKAEEVATLERFIENRNLDTLVEGYLREGNVKRKEVFDYINKSKDRDTRDRLKERFRFQEIVKDLSERSFWLRLQGVPVEARAKVFVERLEAASPEQKKQIWKEYGIVSRAKGIVSKNFRREVSKLRNK